MADLKERALIESIGRLVMGYEERIADLRVEITDYIQQIDSLTKDRGSAPDLSVFDEPLEGTLVQ